MAEKHTAPSDQEEVENETERGRESDENDDICVLKQKLDDKDQQITKLQQELDALKKTLQEIHNQPASLDLPPYELTVTNYKGFKESTRGVTWSSGSYYTHPGGYKFHIDVYPHTMAVYLYQSQGSMMTLFPGQLELASPLSYATSTETRTIWRLLGGWSGGIKILQ